MRLFSMIFGYKQLNKDVEAEGVMYTVVPRQIIKWSHAEAGDDCSLPLLWKQLLPYTLLGSQWLLHLMGTEGDYVINQHIFYQVNLRRKKNLSLRTENCCFHEVFFFCSVPVGFLFFIFILVTHMTVDKGKGMCRRKPSVTLLWSITAICFNTDVTSRVHTRFSFCLNQLKQRERDIFHELHELWLCAVMNGELKCVLPIHGPNSPLTFSPNAAINCGQHVVQIWWPQHGYYCNDTALGPGPE